MAALLRLEDVRAGYGLVEVLKGVSLEVQEGEIVTLIGANGAGKTTTLLAIAGINPVRGGRIVFGADELQGRAAHATVVRGISLAPEGRRIFPRLSVLENLKTGAYTRRDPDEVRAGLERAFALFPILRERASQPGGTLSGGEQQMLAVARALMSRPRLLLLDEPSLGLAPLVVAKIFEVIRELHAQGTTILLVEQNARMALSVAARAYVLETGRIVMSGPAGELARDPRVQAAYLGA